MYHTFEHREMETRCNGLRTLTCKFTAGVYARGGEAAHPALCLAHGSQQFQ